LRRRTKATAAINYKAGQSILNLLHQAAGVAEKNNQHALDVAQKLSHQLVAAEQRVTDLEAEVERHRDMAERAEQWLHKVYSEIEERFRPPGTNEGSGNWRKGRYLPSVWLLCPADKAAHAML
jgi:Ni/Co efflux regulator RcnB